ncbi:MAG: hypothetical protein M1821_002493 [Bathelium mastoideum]|nr:MAG: hypothetical protein M1821_002493 [Bathelium mastoideum]
MEAAIDTRAIRRLSFNGSTVYGRHSTNGTVYKSELPQKNLQSDLTDLVGELDEATAYIQTSPGLDSHIQRRLLRSASRLIAAIESPDSVLWRAAFGAQAQAALKVAHDLGFYSALKNEESGLDASELAARCGCDPLLTARIMRALGCVGIVDEVSENRWASNGTSAKLADPLFSTFAVGLSTLFGPYCEKLPDFLSSTSYSNPQDHDKTLFQYAMDTPQSMFSWLQAHPEKLAVFGATMAAATTLKTQGVLAALSQLLSSHHDPKSTCDSGNHVVLVDVGGGRGNMLERLRLQRPDIKGRIILQDLEHIIQNRPQNNGVEYSVHDFFTRQPIKGARVYFFRHIFHDWPDSACLKILRHTVDAMEEGSRLVIADIVIPNVNASALESLLDIGMITLSGMERSEKHWRQLLNKAGLRILNIRNPTREENESASIIEAVLDETKAQ